MRTSINIFYKTIVLTYYRQNAFFVLVVILFAFGFLSGREHITLINNALISSKLLFYVFILWFFHAVKTFLFVNRQLSEESNYFLYNLRYCSFLERLIVLGYVVGNLSLLTSLYGIFMIFVGFKNGFYLPAISILLFHFFLILAGVILFNKRIHLHEVLEFKYLSKKKFIPALGTPIFLFFNKYLVIKQSMLFLITKTSTFLLILFFVWLYPTDDYDFRLFGFLGVFVAVGHFPIAEHWLRFQGNQMQFDRNMPIPVFTRLLTLYFGIMILLLPEFVIFGFKAYKYISVIDYIQWIAMVSLLYLSIFNLCLKYLKKNDFILKIIFWSSVLLLLLILFKMPIFMLAILSSIFCYFTFKQYFKLLDY